MRNLTECPDFRGTIVHKYGIWDGLFIEASLFQGVLIRGVSLCINACEYALFV